jgi:hypothetical protein
VILNMAKKGETAMTQEAATRIQSAAHKSGTNPDTKARAMSAAAKNATAKNED